MKRSARLLLGLLVVAACGTGGGNPTTVTQDPTTSRAPLTTAVGETFPVTVEADNGPVTIEAMPEAIISLSSTATEMLFAIGAGPQVVAVDDQSNHPEQAPVTDLSGFTPNVEAILSYEPDLVVVGFEPGGLLEALAAADVPVIFYDAATALDDTYDQIEGLGVATGHREEAIAVNETVQSGIEAAIADAPDIPEGTDYYHEVDNTYFTATSTTFIGQIYSMFGLENIADPADEDGSSFGYPQLSSEYIVAADPDLIFLANTFYGESPETVAQRPGWDVVTAVREGNVIGLNSDIVSRWGPRVVEFAESISDALASYVSQS
jgi:iron complex transport system substrate-binding protein